MVKLEELRLKDKTIVIFCSDNGGLGEVANNGNLRGSKGSLYEGGHRVPAIAYWPDYIKAGSITNETVLSMDFFPTFVNMAKKKSDLKFNFDGVDITRLLIEEKSLPDRSIYWKYRKQKVVRHDEWKLLVENDTSYLYNLADDLSEEIDLVKLEKDIASQLKLELEDWERDVTQGVKMRTK